MPPTPGSRLRRSSQRRVLAEESSQNDAPVQELLGKTRKRKKESLLDASDSDQSPGTRESVDQQDADVAVGRKTSCERLLDLLSRHVKPFKKPRFTKETSKRTTRSSASNSDKPKNNTTTPCATSDRDKDTVDYSIFHESQLINMLHNVGMDTRGLNKEALIKSCKTHNDLIPRAVASTSKTRVCSPSTSLPSVEFRRVDFPCSPPTSPLFTRPREQKGKEKATDHTNEQRVPQSVRELSATLEEESEVDDPKLNTKKHNKRTKTSARPGGPSRNTTQQNPCTNCAASDQTETVALLKSQLLDTQERVEVLESDFQAISSLVKKWVTEHDPHKKGDNTVGGRIAARLRFHVETLLGTGNNKALPRPASLQDRTAWMADKSLDEVVFTIDLEALPSNTQGQDPGSLCEDGPGHPNATPQQLSIMLQMMKAVGVTSFRPDFSEAATSKSNKWLWELALKIFLKLVECGEYTGIPLGKEVIKVIRKNLTSHVQTLMKRYRQENWDAARKQKAADEVRRATRMRHLKTLRDCVIISKDCTWPLSAIVAAACSDDETDNEECTSDSDTHRHTRPCRVRRLEWRSSDLQLVCCRIDDYKAKYDSSIPGVSPGQRGRRPRQRIRSQDGPLSKIVAPVGLPVDCYSDTWLNSLSALERVQLEIIPTPMLKKMLTIFDSFM